MGVVMDQLRITEDGRLSIDDYRSIHKAILMSLVTGPKKVSEVIIDVRARHHEFKHVKLSVFVNAFGELMKQKMIVSTYVPEMVS